MNDLRWDQQQWENVAVVQHPTISLIPSHPREKVLNMIFGFICSLITAGCVVFCRRVDPPASRQRSGDCKDT